MSQVKVGTRSVEEAEAALRDLPYENLGYARIDHHRALRKGFPEVVYCEGKSISQVVEIMTRLAARHTRIIASRANAETFLAVQAAIPAAQYSEAARLILVESQPRPSFGAEEPYVLVVSAGTADVPVAEEAAITLEMLGSRVERLYDVGFAGLHRLLDQRAKLQEARLTRILFEETSTLGVRRRVVERQALARDVRTVDTEFGQVQIKIGLLDGHELRARPEYEDCLRLADEKNVPLIDVYRAAERAAAS